MPKKGYLLLYILLIAVQGAVLGCRDQPKENETMEATEGDTITIKKPRVPDWHKNAVIYEVNLRHYTPEGTFRAFESHIPRLKNLGVDILWFMPVQPVSVKNRKGELGSPYAVSSYRKVNPDFGTMEEFIHMLQMVHENGMHAIIDWVPNHTGWDHEWISEHPEWYTRGSDGEITDPINSETGLPWGWTDVADLNYEIPEMREAMIAAMSFWVEEIGIDGFRVDVAHGVPVDFWDQWSDALYSIKPLFMLAEAEVPAIVNNGAFVMDYGWNMHHILNGIAKAQLTSGNLGPQLVKGNVVDDGSGQEAETFTVLDIDKELARIASLYDKGYKMQFTSNHDENAWAGTEFQRFGAGHKAFAVLTATFDGMPLLYSGQESAVDDQYEFFSKDTIQWGDYKYTGFYKSLYDLKHRNRALWNGVYGGPLVKIPTGNDESVYAFIRQKDGDKVVVIINLTSEKQDISLEGDDFYGTYSDIFDGNRIELEAGMKMGLNPWEYKVYSNR